VIVSVTLCTVKGAIRFSSERRAWLKAKELKCAFGPGVFDPYWYVGAAEEITKICIIDHDYSQVESLPSVPLV